MDKNLITRESAKIWKEIGQYKDPGNIKVEIEIYKKMLNIFNVGDYCYFIFSPPNTQIEHIGTSLTQVLGYSTEEFTLTEFLNGIHPDDLTQYLNFEATITEFWQKLPADKVMKYKTRYDFRFRCKNNEYKRLLQQVVVIQSDDEGAVLRTFVVFTDITHLKNNNKMVLSFIGLEGEPSYFDVQPVKRLTPGKELLTRRERDLLHLLSQNLSSRQIAETLHISINTVSTHRKNLLRKTGTSSILQLVRLALDKGWI